MIGLTSIAAYWQIPPVPLAGSAALTVGATGAVTGRGSLAGTSAATVGATGDVAGTQTLLLDVDFTALSLGGIAAATFLSATGLTFTRSTASTVQTSSSAIDATPAINAACIGDRTAAGSRGLVIQQNTRNYFIGSNSPRNLTSGWSSGTGTTTASYADSPDGGTGCSRVVCASGQYGNYFDNVSASRYTFSSWQRSKDFTSNGSMQMAWITSVPGDGLQAKRAASNTWARLSLANGTTSRQYFDTCDARDYSGSGGDTATARDVLVDYIQRELGDFPTEAIATGNAFRGNDVLSYATGSSLITATNRVRFYAKMIPKFASTSQVFYDASGGSGASAAWYLFSWGADGHNYAKIKDSDKKLYVKLANGTEAVSSSAVSFAAYDVVEWDIQVGGNVASVARYKVNGGSWTSITLGTISDTPAPGANPVGLFYNDNGSATAESGQFPCWLQRLQFLTDAGSPP